MVEILTYYILFSLWGLVVLGALINALIKLGQTQGTIRQFYVKAGYLSGVLLFSTIVSLCLLLFGYTLFGIVLFFAVDFLAIIYSLFTLKSTFKVQREINAKIVLDSGKRKLKWSDIFTHSGWVQLTLHFGLFRAGVVIFMVDFLMLLALFLIFNQFLLDGNVIDALRDAFFLAVVTTAFFVYSMKKK